MMQVISAFHSGFGRWVSIQGYVGADLAFSTRLALDHVGDVGPTFVVRAIPPSEQQQWQRQGLMNEAPNLAEAFLEPSRSLPKVFHSVIFVKLC